MIAHARLRLIVHGRLWCWKCGYDPRQLIEFQHCQENVIILVLGQGKQTLCLQLHLITLLTFASELLRSYITLLIFSSELLRS